MSPPPLTTPRQKTLTTTDTHLLRDMMLTPSSEPLVPRLVEHTKVTGTAQLKGRRHESKSVTSPLV